MAFMQKSTAEHLVVVLAGIMMFVALVNTPYVSKYIKDYPMIVAIVGVALIIFSTKLAMGIKFLAFAVTKAFFNLMGGVLLFNGLVNISQVKNLIVTYPLPTMGIAMVLLIFKDKLANIIGG